MTPSAILACHDQLLFDCAFPVNEKKYNQANEELMRLAETVKKIYQLSDTRKQQALMGSGIANTELLCSFSRAIAHFLVVKFPGSVELDHSAASNEEIIHILQLLLPSIEFETVSHGKQQLNTRIRQASGLLKKSEQLEWLMQLFDNCSLTVAVRDELYLQLKIYIRWKLDNPPFSRTFLRLPVSGPFYQEKFDRDIDSLSIVRKRIGGPLKLSREVNTFLLDSLKASLAFYSRETDPVTYADPNELAFFELEGGMQVALVGMTPDKRYSLENYVGYMAFRNGVPVSYGGGWIWGQQCRVGINIFPPFRRGESARIFCQVLRLYYQYFGARQFIVNPNQFGKDNPDGLKSGAFWFYYKLGFRPAKENIRKIADEEWKKIKTIEKYRTPLKTLKLFTGSRLEWTLTKSSIREPDAEELSRLITKHIATDYDNSRKKAIESSFRKMKAHLHPASKILSLRKHYPAIENWSLIADMINDIPQWSSAEKKQLVELIRLKQNGRERDYIRGMQRFGRLWKSLSYL